jgi:CDGSH-type Zn-finger protein/uncharacterized Fe-S cluster protein YjdI
VHQKIHRYEGDALTVLFDSARCIHSEECVHGLPAVFDPQHKPWVDPNAARADETAEVIQRCPTGALHYERKDGGLAEEPPAENVVTVTPDGPLCLHGRIEVTGHNVSNVLLTDTRVALCRCGASKNKPLCDGSHKEAGFHDPGVWTQEGMPPPEPGQALKVRSTRNGPFILDGPFHYRMGNGEEVPAVRRALCRCGASNKKPFCDGSHSRVGFKGEEPA